MAVTDWLYANASTTYNASTTGTVAITASADDVLVVCIYAVQTDALAGGAISVSSVTDTDGLTWTKRHGSSWQGSDTLRNLAEVWWAKKTSSGSTTVTVTTNVSVGGGNIDVLAIGNAVDPDAPWCTDGSLPGVQVDNSGSTITPSVTVSTEAKPLMLNFCGSNSSRPSATGYTVIATHQNTAGSAAARSIVAAKEENAALSSVAVAGSGTGLNLAWIVDAINIDYSSDPTSFTNLGGSGPRRSVFSVTSTLPIASGSSGRPLALTINGVISSSGKPFMTTGTAASGKTLEFDLLGIPRVIDGYKWYQVAPVSPIEFAFEGYNGSTWDTLSTNLMGGAGGTTAPRVVLFPNTTAYSKYRLRETGGTWNDSSIIQVEFRISGHADECGDRTSTITPTTTLTLAGSPPAISNLVDGAYGQTSSDSWWPSASQDPTGKEIKFQFATPRLIKYARIECAAYTGNQGSWKWQGSPDGSTWTDIGSAFTWSMTSDGTTPVHDLSSNNTAYSYYRMLGQSGTIIDDPYYQEAYFDIVDPTEMDLGADLTDESVMTVALYLPLVLAADLIDESSLSVTLSLGGEPIELAADLTDESAMTVKLTGGGLNLAASLIDESVMTVDLVPVETDLESHLSDNSHMSVKLTHQIELAADITDNSTMNVSLYTPTPIHLAAALTDDSRMVAALANVVGKGPFHFAWVEPDETQFVAGTMARDDEDIFAFSLSQNEGDFASLSLVIKNPRIGLLNPSRKKWAWLSYFKDGVATPLFFGRINGIPNNLFDTQITIEFVGRPEDFVAQKAALAETLRVAPFFDPLFISPNLWDDDDVVLEARSANWHIDRVTHEVTISDTIVPEDGTIELQESDHFRDGLQVQLQSPPLRSIVVTCAIPWTQMATGVVSLSNMLTQLWPRNGDSAAFKYPNFISSFTFQGLQDSWPQPGTKMGKSWTVVNGELTDMTFLAVADAPIAPSYIEPTQLQNRISTGSIFLDPALFIKYHIGVNDTYINWSLRNAVQHNTLPVTAVIRGWGKVNLDIQYDSKRSYTENVTLSMNTNVQSVVTEPEDNGFLLLNVTCNPVSDLDRDGSIPIGNVARRSFCDTARGLQALEHLTLLARANLIDKSRVVNTTVDMADFEQAMSVTLRKALLVHDHRLPGGQAVGKVTGYVLSFADGVARASVSITSAIGYGDAVEEVAGDPVYVEDDYVEDDYQVHVNGVSLLPSGDVGITVPEIIPNDDGFDFIKGIVDSNIVTSISVENPPPVQANAIYDPSIYPFGMFGDQAEADSTLQQFPTKVHMRLKQLGSGPYVNEIGVTSTDLVLPKQIDLEAESV